MVRIWCEDARPGATAAATHGRTGGVCDVCDVCALPTVIREVLSRMCKETRRDATARVPAAALPLVINILRPNSDLTPPPDLSPTSFMRRTVLEMISTFRLTASARVGIQQCFSLTTTVLQ